MIITGITRCFRNAKSSDFGGAHYNGCGRDSCGRNNPLFDANLILRQKKIYSGSRRIKARQCLKILIHLNESTRRQLQGQQE